MSTGWGRGTRIAFRFVLAYVLFAIFPFPLSAIPLFGWVGRVYRAIWNPIVVFAGRHVFHLAYDVVLPPSTGSGDTLYDWITHACQLAIAAAIALVWSILASRKTRAYPRLHRLLRFCVRFYLFVVMLGYGMAKVLRTQFSDLDPSRLVRTYGESSPMGLLWTFLGHSTAYTVFCGAVEVIGGIFLCSRRTTTLGALIIAAAMTNVFILNLSYDVPVKLYSFQLLAFAIFLLVPDVRRLANVLLLGRSAAASPSSPIFANARLELARHVVVACVVLGALGLISLQELLSRRAEAKVDPLHGFYEVDSFVRAGEERPPLLTDETRWRRFALYPRVAVVYPMTGPTLFYDVVQDAMPRTLDLERTSPTKEQWRLIYTSVDRDHLVVEGTFRDAPLVVRLHRFDTTKSPLESRGFHWVSEYPFNR